MWIYDPESADASELNHTAVFLSEVSWNYATLEKSENVCLVKIYQLKVEMSCRNSVSAYIFTYFLLLLGKVHLQDFLFS